jgi:hypothetical protein
MATEIVNKCDACGRKLDHCHVGWYELDRFNSELHGIYPRDRNQKIVLCTRCRNNLMEIIEKPIDLVKLKSRNDVLEDALDDMLVAFEEFTEKMNEIKKEHKL